MISYTSIVFIIEEISTLFGSIMETYMRAFQSTSVSKYIAISTVLFIVSEISSIIIYKNFNETFSFEIDCFFKKKLVSKKISRIKHTS